MEVVELLLHHLNLFKVVRDIGDGGVLLLGSDPRRELPGLPDQLVRLHRLFEPLLPLASQLDQVVVHLLNGALPRTNRGGVDQLLLAGSEARIDLLDVGGRHKALPVVHLHLPPILVVRVQKSQHVTFLHADFPWRLFSVVVQGHDALLAKHVNDRGLLLPAVGSKLLQPGNRGVERFEVGH